MIGARELWIEAVYRYRPRGRVDSEREREREKALSEKMRKKNGFTKRERESCIRINERTRA